MIKELIFCTPFILIKNKLNDKIQNDYQQLLLGDSNISFCDLDLSEGSVDNKNVFLLNVNEEFILLTSFLFTEFSLVKKIAQRVNSIEGEVFIIYSDLDAAQDRISLFRDYSKVFEIKRNGSELSIDGVLEKSNLDFITSIPFFEWDTISIVKVLTGLDLYSLENYRTKYCKFNLNKIVGINELDSSIIEDDSLFLVSNSVKHFSLKMPDEKGEDELLNSKESDDIPF